MLNLTVRYIAAICIAAITMLCAWLAYTFCYTLNPTMLGGHGPFAMLALAPGFGYFWGRITQWYLS